MRNRLTVLLAALLVGVTAVAGASARSEATRPLTIHAAASLTEVFRAFDGAQTYNFAGSNALETQIRNGAPADIFASAAPLNTQRLFRAGIVEKPVTFTANRLALIVPRSNPAGIRTIYDLRTKPVKLVVAAPAVPVGGYTLTVLRKLGLSSVLSKVVSRESDVKAVTGKVALGQADAGFVYLTDVAPVAGRARAISIPARAQPTVVYELAIATEAVDLEAAQDFVIAVLGPEGRRELRAARFGLP